MDSGPSITKGSFANWLFGTTQKTFSTGSNVLNWRAVATKLQPGRRLSVKGVEPDPLLSPDSAIPGALRGTTNTTTHTHTHTRIPP